MNCHQARRYWNLYHDSEGDSHLHYEIGEHTAQCPACAEWFAKQSWLERGIEETLAAGQHHPAMWRKILANQGLHRRDRAKFGKRTLLSLVAASVLVAAFFAAPWARVRREERVSLAAMAGRLHQGIESGRLAPEFVSENDELVDAYFKGRVTFPVRCPPRKDAGFQVSGGGTCSFGSEPAAFVSGHVGDRPVSVFVLPKSSLNAFPADREKLADAQRRWGRRTGRYRMIAGVVDRNLVLVVGGTEDERLWRVLDAYGSYPDHHPERPVDRPEKSS